MNKREQVEQAIREACPELKELRFGCVVLLEGGYTPSGEHVVYHEHDGVYEAANIGHTEILTNDTTSFKTYKTADYAVLKKVIGSPIHLEDVMRAIGDTKYTMDFRGFIERIALFSGDAYLHEPKAKYNLSLPFSEQSDELINFLHPILCGKE